VSRAVGLRSLHGVAPVVRTKGVALAGTGGEVRNPRSPEPKLEPTHQTGLRVPASAHPCTGQHANTGPEGPPGQGRLRGREGDGKTLLGAKRGPEGREAKGGDCGGEVVGGGTEAAARRSPFELPYERGATAAAPALSGLSEVVRWGGCGCGCFWTSGHVRGYPRERGGCSRFACPLPPAKSGAH
jgi:hypothetical protein